MNKKRAAAALAIAMSAMLASCANASGSKSKEDTSAESALMESTSALSGIVDGQLDEDGNLVIEKDLISSEACFINYDSDGITVQLIAVRAGDGTVRLAYNTCQTCNPSPRAYFVQKDGKFICQNCGNQFSAEDVGIYSGGCNPMVVVGVTETDTTFAIDSAVLDGIRTKFEQWEGPRA